MTHTSNTLLHLILNIFAFEDVCNLVTICQVYLEEAPDLGNTHNLGKTIGFFNLYFTHYKAYGTDYEREQASQHLSELPRMRSLLKRKQTGRPKGESVNPQTDSYE